MINMADLLMIIHFLWVLFMILGLPLGLWLGSPLLRWAHFVGMLATSFFAMSGMFCPLTIWEEALRWKTDPGFTYGGSFLAEILSPILYPRIEPVYLRGASVLWGIATLAAMIIVKPGSPFRGRSDNFKSG